MKSMHFLLLLGSIVLTLPGRAQSDNPAGAQDRQKHFNLRKGLVLEGYDPVSYFLNGKAQQGSPQYALTYRGVTYHFATSAHLDTFRQHPERYEPAYGGWCAYAMGATGEEVEIDPETFKVKDGRLYLFYHSTFNNTLPKWNRNEADLAKKADQNWQRILSK